MKKTKKPEIAFDRPTISEIKKEFPDFFKKFPQLRDSYFREIEFTKYFNQDMNLTFDELERIFIRCWINELAEAFNVVKPDDIENFVEVTIVMREIITNHGRNKLKAIYLVLKNFGRFRKAMKYWNILNQEERIIMTAPFLTAMDTCMINLLLMTKTKKMSDLFINAPFSYAPMVCGGGDKFVICEVIANEANNPGNSVFGPKGVICPGNIVTSMLLNSMMDLMNNLNYEVIGKPIFERGGALFRLANPGDIKFVSKTFVEDSRMQKEMETQM